MRTYGRTYDEFGTPTWQVVETDANGYNDAVYLTATAQVCQGSPGESPFFADYGIPGLSSVQNGVAPDFYMARTQSQMAPYFANLQISKASGVDRLGRPVPSYSIVATTHQGAVIGPEIPR